MNREILFRGKRMDNGQWVYGYYIYKQDQLLPGIDASFIVAFDENSMSVWNKVDPSTVGQYTGLTDRTGKRIFEGDILQSRFDESGEAIASVVIWELGAWKIKENEQYLPEALSFEGVYPYGEVVGNINDNPELLEGDTKNGEN